ncbi:MAG: hypothetical protein LBF69_07495 [Prevotellaceae bacterium]|jgi:uncharacterized protein (TIGR02145 family)|nr:hypothetical protein [Prevotellaceae bacterium]
MKQRKTIQMLLLAALVSGLSVVGYTQGKVCQGTAYSIEELQAPSDPSSFQWLEDGKEIISGSARGYTVPADKPVGKYTYVRRSKKEGCDWASSNAYTVEVLTCGNIAGDAGEGAMGTFQDPRDNKVYKIVKMPDGKVWFAENLNYQKDLTFNQQSDQANGVPFVSTANGVPAIGSFWCPPVAGATLSADKNTCNVYGALYTWETAMSEDGKGVWDEADVLSNYFNTGAPGNTAGAAANNARGGGRGICPSGWHVPTDKEWAQLLDAVEGNTTYTLQQETTGWWGENVGVKMKSASTYMGGDPGNGAWSDHDNRGTNDSSFGAAPAGARRHDGSQLSYRGAYVYYWSSSVGSSNAVWNRQFNYNNAQVSRGFSSRSNGFSVRCVRN